MAKKQANKKPKKIITATNCAYCNKKFKPGENIRTVDKAPCCEACAERIRTMRKIERDPKLNALNEKFNKHRVLTYVLGLIFLVLMVLAQFAVKYKWPTWLGLTLEAGILISAVSFFIIYFSRLRYRRRIKRLLKDPRSK